MQLTKKDLITKLIDAARKAGNANPFALGFIAFDDLRMKLEGPMTTTGQEWYATHPNDPLGMKDILTVPDDINYNKIVKEVFESLTSDGGLHLWVILSDARGAPRAYCRSSFWKGNRRLSLSRTRDPDGSCEHGL